MFNNDFYELKKALESVTLEAATLKTELHSKESEIHSLKQKNRNLEQALRNHNSSDLPAKVVEQDITIRELRLESGQQLAKISKLKGELQSLNDRMSGIVAENRQFKREAIAKKMVSGAFNGIKGAAAKLKQNKS